MDDKTRAMKHIILFVLFSFTLNSFAQTQANEGNVVWPMFHILKGSKQVRGQDNYVVKVSVETRPEYLTNGTGRITVDGDTFRRTKKLSRSVFTAETQDDRVRDPSKIAMGTGFHVGGNLILTNRHVLSPNQSNWTRCNGLKFKAYDGRSFSCRRVVYCEPNPGCPASATGCKATADFCLISVSGKLSRYPSLPLKAEPLENTKTESFATVGNSGGFGLHFSESKGLRRVSEWEIGVHPQVFHGNSGGPLFNTENQVVGVMYKRQGKKESFAVGMDWMLERLSEVLGRSHPDWITISENIR